MDALVGHRRRYSRAALAAVLDRAGFQGAPRYFNLAGVPGWWLGFVLLGRRSFAPTSGTPIWRNHCAATTSAWKWDAGSCPGSRAAY